MKWLTDNFGLDTNIRITGLTSELNILYIVNKFNNGEENILVVANSLYECNRIFSFISTYSNDVLLFPMDDFLSSVALAASPDLKIKRLETLRLLEHGKHIVVTNLMGYLKFLPSISQQKSISLEVGQQLSRDYLLSCLTDFGYSRGSFFTLMWNVCVVGFDFGVFFI